MDIVNLIIGLASLFLSSWALLAATGAKAAIARFQSQTRMIDCLLKLQHALAVAQRLTSSRSSRLSKNDLDQLRRLMAEVHRSPVLSVPQQRALQFAIAQVGTSPENRRDTAMHALRRLEEDLLSMCGSVRDSIEGSLK